MLIHILLRRTSDIIYPDYTGETFAVRPNENHKWYYRSEMMPDDVSLIRSVNKVNLFLPHALFQVLLIKCFDSKVEPGLSRMSPHTAFILPEVPEGCLHRQSIEVRALVFHEEEA